MRLRQLLLWVFALLLAAAFASAGFWQLGRAGEKQRMLDEAAGVMQQRRPASMAAAADPARAAAYDWAEGRGRFAEIGPVWLDNQQRGGRAGVRAYRVFLPESGTPLLVDLGWLPLAGDRQLPPIPRPRDAHQLRGLLAPPPSAGLPVGEALSPQSGGWLLTRVETETLGAQLGLPALAPRVLRLDPALPLGYDRDLVLLANTLTPDKHRGYALQWFGLAAAVLVTALILTFRARRR